MNLKELLIEYFNELPVSLKIIVTEVYDLERQHSDMLRPRIMQQIKDKIDAEADFKLQKEGKQL